MSAEWSVGVRAGVGGYQHPAGDLRDVVTRVGGTWSVLVIDKLVAGVRRLHDLNHDIGPTIANGGYPRKRVYLIDAA